MRVTGGGSNGAVHHSNRRSTATDGHHNNRRSLQQPTVGPVKPSAHLDSSGCTCSPWSATSRPALKCNSPLANELTTASRLFGVGSGRPWRFWGFWRFCRFWRFRGFWRFASRCRRYVVRPRSSSDAPLGNLHHKWVTSRVKRKQEVSDDASPMTLFRNERYREGTTEDEGITGRFCKVYILTLLKFGCLSSN